MKQFKSVLAMLLALVMILSCVGTAFAAQDKDLPGKTVATEIAKEQESEKAEKKGFFNEDFQAKNSYVYAADETVRAIVVLEGAAEAEVAENGSEKAAAHRVKLVNEHNTVRKAMKGINYELKYEFTTLLNGFSCDVAYGDLEAIAAIDGVKAVYVANQYAAPVLEKEEETKQDYANQMTGNAFVMSDYGIAGQGILVAVLDTGLNLTHEAFQDSLGLSADYGVLAEEDLADIDTLATGKYVNAKVPFSFDYADMDNDVTDTDGHGTHVSGTVGGYVGEVTEDGAIAFTFAGGAPAAQIVSMKIFHDNQGGTTSDIYFYALEDAYRLGVDVVNMSIGAQNGFTYDSSLETEVFGNIYKRMEEAGIIMSVAAGNEYSMAEYSSMGYIDPEYTDYGTVANPSTYEGNVSVASVENYAYPDYVLQIGDGYYRYIDSAEDEKDQWLANFAGQTLDYVVITDADGNIDNGYAESYANFDVTGKVAVVSRGDITFEEKVEFAANAGAIGCIVVNHTANENISMQIETFEVPAVTMNLESLEALMTAEVKQMYVPEGKAAVPNPNAWLMSDFSNWGTSPMLTLDPTITSVGGMVYSSVIGGDDAYEVYSGTSMAAPNASATYANVLAGLYAYDPTMDKAEAAKLAKDLMASTGILLTDSNDNEYSPRKQGGGLACADYSISGYVDSAYMVDPLKELGDDPEKTGVYSFDVTLKNANEWDVYYTDFQTTVLEDCIAYMDEDETIIGNTLMSAYADADVSYTVDGAEVTEFTVPALGEVTVTVTITLTEEEKAYLDAYFVNGTYIEGYVLFNEYYEGELYSKCHATFLAYYGDWGQASALEALNSMDLMEANYLCNTYDADGQGNTYADYGYGPYDILVNLFGNMYTDVSMAYAFSNAAEDAITYLGANPLDLNTTEYMREHISFSTNASDGTYVYADSFYLSPSLLRNVRHIKMTVTNAETGEVYYVDDTEYIPKSVFDTDSGYWANYSMFMWDGTDAEGNYVPSGTVANVNFDIMLPWGEATDTWQMNAWNFDCTVDYTAPVLESVVYDSEAETVTVTASDENYLAGIYLCDSYYDILDYVTYSSDVKGESFTATFDVSGIDAAYVTALDYATNEIEEWTTFYEVGLDATLTFVTPDGSSETVEAKTGDIYDFVAAEAPAANYEFMFWSPEQGSWSEDDVWYVSEPWWFEGDSWEITEPGDYTFYALYAEIATVPLEVANYFLNQADDYTGLWSINGWDVDSGYYVSTDPNALNCNAETVKVSGFEDATIGDWYVEYFTNNTSILMDIQLGEDGLYTVKSVANGKYLATDADMNIKFVDEVDDFAKWDIFNIGGNATYAYSAAVEDAVLCYNDETHVFEILDDSTPAYGSSGEYYASEWFSTFFYEYTDVEEIVLCYTTEYCAHENTEIRDAKEATCTEEGYTGDTYCTVCGEKVATGEAISALGHGETEVKDAKEATYTEEGYTGDTYCTVCGELVAKGEAIPALGSSSGDCYFDDCSDCNEEWYHEAVDFVVSNDLMKGVGNGKFDPNGTLTRAMVVTVLYREAGSPAVSEGATFTDVLPDQWYSDAIAWAQDLGVVNGISATEFAPDAEVTREQIAAILWRYAGSPKVDAKLDGFVDADEISDYAVPAMAWAASEGIFKGDTSAKLNPTDSATRAEFACIIMRYVSGAYKCD